MHGLLRSMIHDAPATASDVLELEHQARRRGTGLANADLLGFWQLHQTWSRRGTASPELSIRLLRTLQACLILESRNGALSIANQVSLGPLRLRFDGAAELRGRRPLLSFSFTSMRLQVGSLTLLNQTLPAPAPQRQPFFALIALGADRDWLCARGRGGGLALWIKAKDTKR